MPYHLLHLAVTGPAYFKKPNFCLQKFVKALKTNKVCKDRTVSKEYHFFFFGGWAGVGGRSSASKHGACVVDWMYLPSTCSVSTSTCCPWSVSMNSCSVSAMLCCECCVVTWMLARCLQYCAKHAVYWHKHPDVCQSQQKQRGWGITLI